MIPWSPGLSGQLAADLRETYRDLLSEMAATSGFIGGKGTARLLVQEKTSILNTILSHVCHNVLRASNTLLCNATFQPYRTLGVLLPPSGHGGATW